MIDLKPKSYTVKSNDNLDRIAQNLGYKSWAVIYNSRFNQNFRIKRPNPNIIKPGDTIFLPPLSRDLIESLNKRIDILNKAKKEYLNTMDNLSNSSKENLEEIVRHGKIIDASATVLTLIADLSSIVKKGADAMKAIAEKEKELIKEITDDVLNLAYDPIAEVGLEAYAEKSSLNNNIVTAVSQIIVQGFLNMKSPSFWSNTIAGLVNGKSWQDAVTETPEVVQKEIENRINQNKMRVVSDIDNKINNYKRLITKLSGMIDRPLPIVDKFI